MSQSLRFNDKVNNYGDFTFSGNHESVNSAIQSNNTKSLYRVFVNTHICHVSSAWIWEKKL